ncbi:MAG: type III-B CRISPR-associated protein Cas10/Cmr2 [Lewinellaceae bacterium]|nr:type III-B CRISPR-associated protein Cas10/Cmr2 [Lewinellaceae bacterium]
MTHLFLFTIGPVQGFIKQARKTRDLYAGSQILSDLIGSGMDFFINKGGHVIFPYDDSPSKPNRFLGWIVESDPSLLPILGKDVEETVRKAWRTMAGKAIEGLSEPAGFDQQIEQALEMFWVFHPASKEDYHLAYREIERTLGAIKNVRPVQQYHYQKDSESKIYGERGRKCSLDGERNVKFYRIAKEDKRDGAIPRRLFLKDLNDVTFIQERDGVGMKVIAPGEGLSAVSFVKRRIGKGEDFQPTAFFAAADFIDRIERDPLLDQKYSIFQSCFPNSWDEQLLFEENYTSKYFIEQGINHHFDTIEKAKNQLLKFYGEVKIEKPKGYYALLHFDGDNMGKWLSGANLAEGRNTGIDLFNFHENLAKQLAHFAHYESKDGEEIGAFQYLTPPKGRTIYAGGDDFLGFVNLEYVFKVLEWLRRNFDEHINQRIENKKTGENFTFSAGLVIAHYKTPLHVVLDWARNTEKAAKKHIHPCGQRKDTLGISVLKASGEINQAFVPWYHKDENDQKLICTEALCQVTESLRENFSDKWLRTLDAAFYLMKNRNSGELELADRNMGKEMVKTEMRRLLKRACQKSGESEELVEKLLPFLLRLLGPNPTENFGNFSKILHICDFIERKTHGSSDSAENCQTIKSSVHA